MATTDVRQSIRSMGMEEQLVTIAVTVLMDRLGRLEREDRDDLLALVKDLGTATTPEDFMAIRDTMVEILDSGHDRLERADLGQPGVPPERWRKWVDWVSKELRDARIAAGLTQEQLAAKTGLPQSHISRIENAKHSPARATIEKIAAALGKPASFFDCE